MKRFLACVTCAAFASCLDPTEMVLEISTDVACDDVAQNGVAIAVGLPGNDSNAVATSTRNCVDGGVGSLVVIPSGVGSGVGIRVTLGVDASVENCNAENQFAGCIVARRALLYVPHTALTLPIELQRACLGTVCDPNSTCFDGACVDAGVTCANGTCNLSDASTPPSLPPVCGITTAIESTADPVTPHITTMPNGGYVITWVSKQRLMAVTLDPTGTPTTTSPVAIYTNGPPFTPGPLGSNGQSLYTLVDAPPKLILLTTPLIADGGTSLANSTGVVPLAGVLASDGGYTSFYGYEQSGSPPEVGEIVALSPGMATPITPVPNAMDGGSFGFARSGATYFASFASADGNCYVESCDETFLCSPGILTEPSCGTIRFAPGGDPNSWVATVADTTGYALLVGPTSSISRSTLATSPDDPKAFIPIATKSASRGVARIGDELTMIPDGKMLAATAYGAKGGVGAGFDVVADNPATSAQYTIVYWMKDASGGSTGNIQIIQCTQ